MIFIGLETTHSPTSYPSYHPQEKGIDVWKEKHKATN
jgi:hypothetical protein